MKLKCFYCGRDVKIQESDGKYFAKCTYPRCRLKPETDLEDTIEQVVADWEIIKESLK